MGRADFVLPCGQQIDETDVMQAFENYGIDTEIKQKRVLFENGYIASGMPSPEEQFERATGKKFDPETMEIEFDGAEGEQYDEPVTPFRVVEKMPREPEKQDPEGPETGEPGAIGGEPGKQDPEGPTAGEPGATGGGPGKQDPEGPEAGEPGATGGVPGKQDPEGPETGEPGVAGGEPGKQGPEGPEVGEPGATGGKPGKQDPEGPEAGEPGATGGEPGKQDPEGPTAGEPGATGGEPGKQDPEGPTAGEPGVTGGEPGKQDPEGPTAGEPGATGGGPGKQDPEGPEVGEPGATGGEPGQSEPVSQTEDPNQQKESESRYITKITKVQNFKKILAATIIAVGLLSGINRTTIVTDIPEPTPIVQDAGDIDEIYEDVLTYGVTETEEEISDDEIEDIIKTKIGNLNLGDEIYVPEGTCAYTNSQQTGGYLEYGDENLGSNWSSGMQPITGISIVKNGVAIGYVENFTNDESLHDVNFQEFIDEVCEQAEVSPDEVTVMVHTGVRHGWVNINDLINETTLTPDDIEPAMEDLSTYTGTIEDFEGDTFTITVDDGTEVTFDAVEGSGMEIVGSDGKTYIADVNVSKVEVESPEVKNESSEFEERGEEFVDSIDIVETQTKLGYDLTDLSKALIIAGIGLAAALAVLQKKKNDFNKDNPMYAEFETQEELEEFLKGALQSDEEKSRETLKEFLKRVFIKEDKGIVELLTDENLDQIIDIAKEHMKIERVGVKDNRVVAETTEIKEDGTPEVVQTNLQRNDEIKVAREVHGEKIAEGTLSKKMLDFFKNHYKKMRELPRSKVKRVSKQIGEDSKDGPEIESLKPEIEGQEQDTDERGD